MLRGKMSLGKMLQRGDRDGGTVTRRVQAGRTVTALGREYNPMRCGAICGIKNAFWVRNRLEIPP